MKSNKMNIHLRALAAVMLVMALVFGFVAAPAVEALAIEEPLMSTFGSKTTVKMDIDDALLVDMPMELVAFLDSLSMTFTQMSDHSGEMPLDFYKLDVAGADDVAFSIDMLAENGMSLIDIPALFDTTLYIDGTALLNEAMDVGMNDADIDAMSMATMLKNIDMTRLTTTFTGISEIIASHTPAATALAPEPFTIDVLSADLARHEIIVDSASLVAILNDMMTFLETDEGAIELFDKLLQPLMAQEAAEMGEEVKTWSEYMAEAKMGMANDLNETSLVVQSLVDADGIMRGFNFTMLDNSAEASAEDAITIQALMLDTENMGELELLVTNPYGEAFRVFFTASDGESSAYNGAFMISIDEVTDMGSQTMELVSGSFTNMQAVPFNNAMMVVGDMQVSMNADQDMGPLTMFYTMEQVDENKFSGMVGLENMIGIMMDVTSIPASDLVIPMTMLDKEVLTITSMADLENLMTEDMQMRLMQIIMDLGIPLEGMAPMPDETP